MRHRPTVTALFALPLFLLGVAPVSAAPTIVIGEPPPGWTSIHQDCADAVGGAAAGSHGPQFGPSVTGTGDGSVRLHAPSTDMEGFSSQTFPTFNDLVDLGTRFREDANSVFALRITVHTGSGQRALVWAPAPQEEVFLDGSPFLNSTVFTVYDPNNTANTFGTTTISAYQSDHPTADFEIGFVSWGCGAASTVYVDTIRFQVDGTDYSYDFEPEPTSVTITRDKTSLTFGQQVTLTAIATNGSGPLAGVTLKLYPEPSRGFADPIAVVTDSNGIASLTHKPTYNTTYRWQFPGGGENAPSWSPERAVSVKSKVTASLVDSSVQKGARIKVTGKVTPHWNNLPVTLWRQTSTGRVKLGTSTTLSDDSYKVVSGTITTTGTATWKVYVSAAATEDNAAGRSALMSVRIN